MVSNKLIDLCQKELSGFVLIITLLTDLEKAAGISETCSKEQHDFSKK